MNCNSFLLNANGGEKSVTVLCKELFLPLYDRQFSNELILHANIFAVTTHVLDLHH